MSWVLYEQLLYTYHLQWVKPPNPLIFAYARDLASSFDNAVKTSYLAALYPSLTKQA
jgi:hypothetical protein